MRAAPVSETNARHTSDHGAASASANASDSTSASGSNIASVSSSGNTSGSSASTSGSGSGVALLGDAALSQLRDMMRAELSAHHETHTLRHLRAMQLDMMTQMHHQQVGAAEVGGWLEVCG